MGTSTPFRIVSAMCSPGREEATNSKILTKSALSKITKWAEHTHIKPPKVQEEGRILIELENRLEQWGIKHEEAPLVSYRPQNNESLRSILNYRQMLKNEIANYIDAWHIKGVKFPKRAWVI